jgi:hypothetical protein
MCLQASASMCASEKDEPVVSRGGMLRSVLAWRHSRAVEKRRRGYEASPSVRGIRMQPHIKPQPYESSASPMVGVLLASELVLLLADKPQLGGPINPPRPEPH